MAESGTNWARVSGSLVIILLLLGLVGSQLLASEEQPQLLSRRSLRESVRRFLAVNDIYVLNSTYDVNTTTVTVVGTVTGPNASATGYWSTRGRQILDFYGREVFFSGVSWNGLENIDGAPHGLWARSWQSMLDQMVGLGLNVLRLPFSGSMLREGYMPQNINYYANPDLRNLTSLQIMDVIVRGAGARGMKVFLDYHRLNAGYEHEWGLWYDANTSETQWINNWLFLVDRYRNDSTVVGVDLFNEPHHDEAKPPGHLGPEWAPDGVNATINWRTSAIRCANAIHKVNPNLLIAVQGLDVYRGQYGLWGGVFLGQLDAPLNLTVPNKLIFQTHDLGPSTFNQSYYNAPDFPANLPAQWDRMWGFLWDRNMTPVWVGEFGAKFDPYCTSDRCAVVFRQEQLWLGQLVQYIQNKSLPWTWWSWDPTSEDTGGLLADDMQTLRADKYAYIQNLTYPGFSIRNASTSLPTGVRTSGL